MSDERNGIWIKVFKYTVIIACCILVLVGIVFGISDASAGFIDIDIIGDDDFGDFIIWIIIFGICAAYNWITGMLIANFFTNVQDIRVKLYDKNN